MATKPNLTDRTIRGFDIQVGDMIWLTGSYHEVTAVEYNTPFEGMVKFALGEVGNPTSDQQVCHVRGNDEVLRLHKTGREPGYTWIKLPDEVRVFLPGMVRQVGEVVQREIQSSPHEGIIAMLAKGKIDSKMTNFLKLASWVVDICDDDGLKELMRQLNQ